MATRQQNERLFAHWHDLNGGGRIYVREISGRSGGYACYFKEVDAQENTIRFWQEIYDRDSRLIAWHEKFPFDLGHQSV